MKIKPLLWLAAFPVLAFGGYTYQQAIYDLSNSVWTGVLPVLRGGTGTTTSTGTGSVVLSTSPTLTGTPALGTPSASGTVSVTAIETFRSIGNATFQSWYSAGSATRYGFLQHDGTNIAIDNEQVGGIIFYTSGIERGRVDTTGLFLLGYSADQGGGQILQVAGSSLLNGAVKLSGSASNITYPKITTTGTAPGAGNCKEEWVAGTTAGTCKKIAYCGTSTTAVTIVDNVGSGC